MSARQAVSPRDDAGMFADIIAFIRELYKSPDQPILLHKPQFAGNEKAYVAECIESSFVSSVGQWVVRFEQSVSDYTGARHAVATVNGTAALHVALLLADVGSGDEVLMPGLTFVATANAVSYCGARPIFIDSERDTMGMSPAALEAFFLERCVRMPDGSTCNKLTGARIAGCLPMHVCGHPVRIDAILELCDYYGVPVIEDAAESLGSFFIGRHTGRFGKMGVLSFNGNKTITTGGGGMILTEDDELAVRARHLTTTAKLPHAWDFAHDMVGYNYRLPGLNAALGCAQMEQLPRILERKREIALAYKQFFEQINIIFMTEPPRCRSNWWLNAIMLENIHQRDAFLAFAHERGVLCRPLWSLMTELPMYASCLHDGLQNARFLQERVVNLPSGTE